MSFKQWLLTGWGVVSVGIVLTLIVLAESIFPPWAPYFIVYAILAIVLPILLKTFQFGSFGAVMKSHWKIILGVLIVAVLWDSGIITWLLDRVLAGSGVASNPFYSLGAATEALSRVAAVKFGITPDTAMMLYAVFVLIWAPIGEELFYRGYMQGVLRQSGSFTSAALISAAFFGIRHATHFFFLWPAVPWVAALTWTVSAFVFGLLMSYLYEKTHSLYPPMLVHALVNIIGIALSM